MKKSFIILVTAFALLTCSFGSSALAVDAYNGTQEPQIAEPAAMLVDVTATRPLGMVSIAAGTATFIVSLPFSLLGGNAGSAFESLIVNPIEYTFFRPLGYI